MSDRDARIEELARKKVVYRIPGMDAATIRQDEPYRTTSNGALLMDIYYPAERQTGERLPVVVIVMGYPDPQGFCRKLGWAVSWAQLIAASGMAAVIFGNQEPTADVHFALQHIRQNAASLGIDEKRIGVAACSGNVAVALSALMQDAGLKCAALLYGYTLDLYAATGVADMARLYGFDNACAGKSVDDLPSDVPLFLVRAGRDQFTGLNDALDLFLATALARNLPVTLVNHANGPHAFDLDDDSETSREIVKQILAFMQFHLQVTTSSLFAGR
ncbi:MAG: alpha/beta hydrolase [Candidatus Acidiferrales bacterium]